MKKIIKLLVPNFLKNKLRNYYFSNYKQLHLIKTDIFLNATPVYELQKKHLKNAKLITDRLKLLKVLPKGGRVLEVGVDEGNFSNEILLNNEPAKLHLVDFWGSERYNQTKRKHVEQRFKNEIDKDKLEIHLGYSTEVVHTFPNDYFDWVYIDTVHDYKTTFEEFKTYSEKIKPGGFLAGHDYTVGNWKGLVKYGVIEAVHQFCVEYNWEFAYLTMETQAHRSFVLKRIGDV